MMMMLMRRTLITATTMTTMTTRMTRLTIMAMLTVLPKITATPRQAAILFQIRARHVPPVLQYGQGTEERRQGKMGDRTVQETGEDRGDDRRQGWKGDRVTRETGQIRRQEWTGARTG